MNKSKHAIANLALNFLRQALEANAGGVKVDLALATGPDLCGGTQAGENSVEITLNDQDISFAINHNGTLSIYAVEQNIEHCTTETDVKKLLEIANRLSEGDDTLDTRPA